MKCGLMSERDVNLYTVLGVPSHATKEEIKCAYRECALRLVSGVFDVEASLSR